MKPFIGTWRYFSRSRAHNKLWRIPYSCSFYSCSSESSVFGSKTKVNEARVQNIFKGLVDGDRASLASAITLIESQNPVKKAHAQALLSLVMQAEQKKANYANNKTSFRIGLSGPPGAGKSTFIEALGMHLIENGHKVAVLTVDPSSATSGGSILGDKTRMILLSRDRRAYIRPSPTSGHLGGVTRTTNESIILCESAGFDVILIETVGVGQSEYNVAYMVDLFALLIPPGGGDELQGLKRGIIELTDLVIVNKSDGNLLPAARLTQAEYLSALKFIAPKSKLWKPQVLRVSSITKEGIPDLWQCVLNFRDIMLESEELKTKRQSQYKMWMWNLIESQLMNTFQCHPKVAPLLDTILNEVKNGIITPGQGADFLIKKFSE